MLKKLLDECGRTVTKKNNKKEKGVQKTYSTRDSLVVTDPTTSLAIGGLFMGERTGSRVFPWVVVVGAKYAEFGSPGV